MKSRKVVKPGYRSPLREAQAERTRRNVIAAAGRLFVERGYVATSMDDIAEAAEVSRATVFNSVGGKGQLLKVVFDVAIVGDDDATALPERARSRAIRAEPAARRYLALYAELLTEMAGRLAPISEAVRSAAGADLDARLLWTKHQAERRIGAANVVADVVRKGRLRKGLTEKDAADIVWVLNGPGVYFDLVHGRGWTPERFTAWLTAAFHSQLLGDRATDGGQPA